MQWHDVGPTRVGARTDLLSSATVGETTAECASLVPVMDSACRMLPGQLLEDVAVTPGGQRRHAFKHTSPGGTTNFDEYVSPAGVQQHACEQRLICMHRLAAARRAAARVQAAGCGSCEACREYARESVLRRRSKDFVEWHPSVVKRSRLVHYRACEKHIMPTT